MPTPLIALATTTFAFCLLSACNASAEAQYDLQALAKVESIALLPIAFPSEIDSKAHAKAMETVFTELRRNLALKGYVVDRPRIRANCGGTTVGFALAKATGNTEVLDDAIQKMKDAVDRILDPDFDGSVRETERRRRAFSTKPS